jgi:hypothetical protein
MIPTSAMTLTVAQLERIENNRRAALERLELTKRRTTAHSPFSPENDFAGFWN